MKVQKAIVEASNQIKWLVIGNDYLPIQLIQRNSKAIYMVKTVIS